MAKTAGESSPQDCFTKYTSIVPHHHGDIAFEFCRFGGYDILAILSGSGKCWFLVYNRSKVIFPIGNYACVQKLFVSDWKENAKGGKGKLNLSALLRNQEMSLRHLLKLRRENRLPALLSGIISSLPKQGLSLG